MRGSAPVTSTWTSQYHFPEDSPRVPLTPPLVEELQEAVKFPFDRAQAEPLSAEFQVTTVAAASARCAPSESEPPTSGRMRRAEMRRIFFTVFVLYIVASRRRLRRRGCPHPRLTSGFGLVSCLHKAPSGPEKPRPVRGFDFSRKPLSCARKLSKSISDSLYISRLNR